MKNIFQIIFGLLILICAPFFAHAQDRLSLTLTPPFVDLSLKPGEQFGSSLKIVNTNPGPLTVFATVMDFTAQGEEGQGRFSPVLESEENSLATWINVPQTGVVIPEGKSGEVPFTVSIPKDAPPGGHYAAILIGTKPYGPNASGSVIKVSSYISSLMFVRISGDVVESGAIREFSASKKIYDNLAADFTVRFENTGNVHVRPEGDIVIYDMWGRPAGRAEVNQSSNLGNVLPKSIRKYNVSWSGSGGIFSIGQYSAVITLAFGQAARQNVTRTITFWVLPRSALFALGGLLALIFLVIWAIRRYIRRTLTRELQDAPSGRPIRREESVVDLRRTSRRE